MNERNAIEFGNNRKELHKRLKEARSCLTDHYLKRFPAKGSKFDFTNRRLINHDRTLVLQWLVRISPHLPVSYENQQTTEGTVILGEWSKP